MASPKIPVEKLTSREIDVLKLIATGRSTKEVATTLGIAFKTAACHRSRIMSKLNIHEIANLTRYAIRNGYIDAGPPSGQPAQIQIELFDRLDIAAMKYRRALEEYGTFLRDRETIGLTNPDGATGARRLRDAEHFAHQEYHAALVALREFLLGKS